MAQRQPSAPEAPAASSSPVASPATSAAVELPALLRLIAALAATDLGRARTLVATPSADEETVEARRQAYRDAARLIAERRLVPLLDHDLEPLLDSLRSDVPPFGGEELIALADLLRASGEAITRIRTADPALPVLGERVAELTDLSALSREILLRLDRKGAVREDASPALGKLRRQIRGVRDQIYNELGDYVGAHGEHLGEQTIPMRAGRMVVMLQAGARGRLDGLVHGRSGSGRSFYFEPLEVVEANNSLQQAISDEEAEKARILRELLEEARRQLPEIERQAELLGELDGLQAAYRFAELADARLVNVAERHDLELVAARHPLLDPRLADLRQRALGRSGHDGEVVPLDLDFSSQRRALVLTGPNAGGKTVALKTLGLLCLAHQCGLPVPAASGSRLPILTRVVATVGDEQDLMSDRSTFSGRLMRLEEAWRAASPNSLMLLDELGSGTDPAEGSALSAALLEGLVEAGSLALITTHLALVAAEALDLEGAGCAAMEFDGSTGQPTFRLVHGPPGGSEALALARRLGLPETWLDRAEARLGPEHRDLRRLIAEMERLRQEAAAARDEAVREAADASLLRQRLADEQDALKADRKRLAKGLRAELEAFRVETTAKLKAETDKIRRELESGRRKSLEARATARLFEDAPKIEVPRDLDDAPPELGDEVQHRTFGWRGRLEKVDRGRAEILVRGKRVRCRLDELDRIAGSQRKRPPKAAVAQPEAGDIAGEIKLLGKRVEPALVELDAYLDRVLLSGRDQVRIVHGHGTGRLRDAVRHHLRTHPAIADQRPGRASEGGEGATVATLRGA
ncbi:MAG: Smr/MutS family protein [Acidobacteriota bacterium]